MRGIRSAVIASICRTVRRGHPLLSIALLLSGPANARQPWPMPAERIKANALARKVAACGFKNTQVRYDGIYNWFWIETQADSATDQQLTCAAKTAHDTALPYKIDFKPPLHERFTGIYEAMLRNDAMQAVKACGFQKAHWEQYQDDDVRDGVLSYMVKVENVEAPTKKQLTCAIRVVLETNYSVGIRKVSQDDLWKLYEPMEDEYNKELTRAGLKRLGYKARVPVFPPSSNRRAFPKKLEAFCGPGARGALKSDDQDLTGSDRLDDRARWCLYNVVQVSGFMKFASD